MYNKDEWIIVKTHSKHSFNPNRLKVKSSDKNKISYEKMYNDSKKTMEEIE